MSNCVSAEIHFGCDFDEDDAHLLPWHSEEWEEDGYEEDYIKMWWLKEHGKYDEDLEREYFWQWSEEEKRWLKENPLPFSIEYYGNLAYGYCRWFFSLNVDTVCTYNIVLPEVPKEALDSFNRFKEKYLEDIHLDEPCWAALPYYG